MDDGSFSFSSSLEISEGGNGSSDEDESSNSSLRITGQSVSFEGSHHGVPTNGIRQDEGVSPFGLPIDFDSQYAQKTRQWVLQVPIGLGLCPWAGKSHRKSNLRYVTCVLDNPFQVMELVYSEMERLLAFPCNGDSSWQYSTTLLICPFVNEWKDFKTFEQFVNNGCFMTRQSGGAEMEPEFRHRIKSYVENRANFQSRITLVPFHPEFIRWRGLPEEMGVGATVQSYWGIVGSKSGSKAGATIIETENKVFGKQKVKIRFHEELEGRRLEQYVPIDWILGGTELSGPPLVDNAMHQAPYPTIHLISNQDLVSLSIRDISRVKRKNAQRMMKLGWPGIEKATVGG